MSVTREHVDFAKRIFTDRVGNDYVYGGNWDPFNLKTGTDCSGLVTDELDAVINGTAMSWTRHGISTESYRYVGGPGSQGPFGAIRVASPADFPATAIVKIALHHGPGGGANSHMWCEVDGVRMESNGTNGCVTGSQARSAYDTSYANDWFYLPGDVTVSVRGLDYAGGRPGGAAIKAAGYQFVVRYLSDGGPSLPGKLLTPNEANDLRANGVEIVSNWETYANRMREGFGAGVADAQAALAQVLRCGGRKERPIYFSADWDTTEGDQAGINDYCRGAASVIGVENVGIYGGFWSVSRALNAGVAKWAWQTHAWSGNNFDGRAQLEQLIGYKTVGGIQCDENISHATDYGQWSFNNTGGNVTNPDYPKETWDQLRLKWNMLGGHTVVEALAEIRDKVTGSKDAGKPGVS